MQNIIFKIQISPIEGAKDFFECVTTFMDGKELGVILSRGNLNELTEQAMRARGWEQAPAPAPVPGDGAIELKLREEAAARAKLNALQSVRDDLARQCKEAYAALSDRKAEAYALGFNGNIMRPDGLFHKPEPKDQFAWVPASFGFFAEVPEGALLLRRENLPGVYLVEFHVAKPQRVIRSTGLYQLDQAKTVAAQQYAEYKARQDRGKQ